MDPGRGPALGASGVGVRSWKPASECLGNRFQIRPELQAGWALLPGGSISFSLISSFSPRAEPEKKSGHRPRSHGDGGLQKELMIPGIVDFQLIQTALRTPRPQTPGAYRFGRLSHHSFFSRHHPHPQRVTHIQGRPGVGRGPAGGGGVVLKMGKGGVSPHFQAETRKGWGFGRGQRAPWPLASTWSSKDLTRGTGSKANCLALDHVPHYQSSHFRIQGKG